MRAAIIATVVTGLACAAASAQGLVEWREQPIPGVCTLRYAVPDGWTVETRAPLPGAIDIRILPAAGAPARVLINGMAAAAEAGLKGAGDIKKAAREMGEEMLPGSVEKKVELVKLEGSDGAGFFYTLTDRRADLPEGEFRVTTQGIMAVGPLRLAVTVLAGEKGSPAAQMAFSVLRTAECQPVRK